MGQMQGYAFDVDNHPLYCAKTSVGCLTLFAPSAAPTPSSHWRSPLSRVSRPISTPVPESRCAPRFSHWLQSCPHCEYAAPELSYAPEGVAVLVQYDEYGQCVGPFLKHAFFPR